MSRTRLLPVLALALSACATGPVYGPNPAPGAPGPGVPVEPAGDAAGLPGAGAPNPGAGATAALVAQSRAERDTGNLGPGVERNCGQRFGVKLAVEGRSQCLGQRGLRALATFFEREETW